MLQYERATDSPFALAAAKAFVQGKLRNCRTRCMELDRSQDPSSRMAIEQLRIAMREAHAAENLAGLMGVEGRGTRWYFSVLRRHLNEPWAFSSRERRPAPDPVNALLSLAYTLLHEDCRSALQIVGLDPACGFLHRPRVGHASLASDLMEEFRPVIADTVVWALLNKRMLAPSDFAPSQDDGIRLTPDGWRVFARHYTRRLETRIRIPGRATQTTYRKLLEIQAWQLVRVIEGAQLAYEPYVSR
jgi:CRISPR-associated protein Cas1